MPRELNRQYQALKLAAGEDLAATAVSDLIVQMAARSRLLLREIERVDLQSRVADKTYFGYRGAGNSRPINTNLYLSMDREFRIAVNAFLRAFQGTRPPEIVRAVYTLAYSVLAAHDVFEVGRKASATFFEILVGHIVSRSIGTLPRRKVQIPESGADLPTDYVFDPGPRRRKIHLPIKTSTRERGVQAWVHQLVLDRIFGDGAYNGILVVASETKRNARTGEVIEICVPRQLQMFQARVARITTVYYLDPPAVYLALNRSFPRVNVRSFGTIVREVQRLLRSQRSV